MTIRHFDYEHVLRAPASRDTIVNGTHTVTIEADANSRGRVAPLAAIPSGGVPDVPIAPWGDVPPGSVVELKYSVALRWRVECVEGTLKIRSTVPE